MGVHTRLTDEAEPWKIKRTLEMVREIGSPWIVEFFPWAYIEPNEGEYNWEHSDLVISHARQQGLTVVARLGYVPDWARPADSTPLLLEADRFEAFAHFAARFARRYQDQVSHIIIWNEPNLSLEWGYRPVDPDGYTELLRTAYPLIKEANPKVIILAGALAPTMAPPGSDWGMNDLDYLQAMYDAGAADFFDMLAIHVYGWQSDADEPPAPDRINFRRAELLREIMVRNGDEQKQAMITETGWNDHPRWTQSVRPAKRIENTLRAYEIALNQWPWLTSINFWVFRFPWDARSYQDYYTFVATDFEPKPIYFEVARYARGAPIP